MLALALAAPALGQSVGPVGPPGPGARESGTAEPFAQAPDNLSEDDADKLRQIRDLCAEGCFTEAELVDAALLAPANAVFDGVFIVGIEAVQRVPSPFSLHSSGRPRPTCVVIEIAPDIMEELLQQFEWEALQEQATEDEIVVARTKRSQRPSLSQAQLFFAGRQVVVRGEARVTQYPLSRIGSSDGHIRIRLDSADDLVRVPLELAN
jgi:hypothetical protein